MYGYNVYLGISFPPQFPDGSGGSVRSLLGHELDETNGPGLEGVEFNVRQHEYSGPGNVLPSELEVHVEERPARRDGLGIDDVVCLSRGIR